MKKYIANGFIGWKRDYKPLSDTILGKHWARKYNYLKLLTRDTGENNNNNNDNHDDKNNKYFQIILLA